MAKRRRSFAWARQIPRDHPLLDELSAEAFQGLEHARRLAENARERSVAALRGELLPVRLTAQELAADDIRLTPPGVYQQIQQAQIELFGKVLGERAIAYQLKRWPKPRRCCAEEGCRELLPRHASASRRYCTEHASGAARVRRHRRRALD